jgi:hypothetical protein
MILVNTNVDDNRLEMKIIKDDEMLKFNNMTWN